MDDDASRSKQVLRRITATLGIPVADLFIPFGEPGSGPSSVEVEDLLRMFELLRDPQARARVMDSISEELNKEVAHEIRLKFKLRLRIASYKK